MTLDTSTSKTSYQSSQNSSTPNVIKKSRTEVVKTIQEITDFDEITINRAIEACQDSEGRYSMDTVLNILMDEKYSNEQKRDSKSFNRQYGTSPSSNEESNKYLSPTKGNSSGNNVYGQSNNIEDEIDEDYEQIANYSSNNTAQNKTPEMNLLREEGKPSGLKNLGNTCWFNSIIQALFHLPEFRQIIFSFQMDQYDLSKLDENSKNMLEFVAELRKLFALMLKSKRKVINPSQTLRCLKNCSKYDVELFNQEDVSEFTTILVNLIEESFNILFNLKHQSQEQQQKEETVLALKLNENLNLSQKEHQLTSSTLGHELNLTKIKVETNKMNLSTDTANNNNNNNNNKIQFNLKKNRSNPIVNLLNGDILVDRKHSDENVVNTITEIFREVNIQMLNSRNLHSGLELEWGETSIDKHIPPTTPLSPLSSFNSLITQQETQKSTDSPNSTKLNRSIYEQESWIKTLPKVLFICLNRYKFVKATQSSSKILEPFEFYQHIYLDRYMNVNKDIIKEKRKELKVLKDELKILEEKLNSIKNYKCSSDNQNSYALDEVFKCVLHFVKTDYSLNDVFEKIKPVNNTLNIDRSNQALVDEGERLSVVENCLVNWIKQTELKIGELKTSIKNIIDKINTAFDDETLKNYKYNLHSVCIHEGTSTSGHFWTYIWNPKQSKWYKYNDTEVCETTWEDVYANSIGGSNSNHLNNQLNDLNNSKSNNSSNNNDLSSATNKSKQSERIPSAYFLIYTKADATSLYQEKNELDSDLQKYLKHDQEMLESQLSTLRYKRILNDSLEQLKKSNQLIAQASQNVSSQALPNQEQNNQTCLEHAKAFCDSTLESLSASYNRINKNSNVLDYTAAEDALKHAINYELNKYTQTKKDIEDLLPEIDLRINHILIFFNANSLSTELKTIALLDLFRIQIFPDNEIRLKILQTLAQLKYNEYVLASINTSTTNPTASPSQSISLIKQYEKYLVDYRDYRSIIAAFINAVQFMETQRYEEAAQFFCVACEYNERITSYTNFKMKGMDHEFLLANRRKCLKLWNQNTIRKLTNRNMRMTDLNEYNLNQPGVQFQQLSQQEINSIIETMINKFLPCFFRLASSTQKDKDMIEDIRKDWLAVIDSILPGSTVFHDFMAKLFEEPTANHYHSLNVNKTNLSNRYRDVVQLVKKL